MITLTATDDRFIIEEDARDTGDVAFAVRMHMRRNGPRRCEVLFSAMANAKGSPTDYLLSAMYMAGFTDRETDALLQLMEHYKPGQTRYRK